MLNKTLVVIASIGAVAAVIIAVVVMLPNIIAAMRLGQPHTAPPSAPSAVAQPLPPPAGNVISCNPTNPGPGNLWCPVQWDGGRILLTAPDGSVIRYAQQNG